MSTVPYARQSKQNTLEPFSPVLQLLLAMLGGLALFVVLVLALVFGFSSYYSGEVYPGVSVAGIDLSGLSQEQATKRLSAALNYPNTGRIAFREGEQVWLATPVEVGLFLDAESSARAAYSFGRSGNPLEQLFEQFQSWYKGVNLPPLLVYDERMAQDYVENIAMQIDRPTVEASLRVNGVDVVVRPGQIGRTVDVSATIAPLEEQLRSFKDGILPVVVNESEPAILDVSQQAEIARQILSQPLTLTVPDQQEGDPGPWTYEPEKLAKMLEIERVEAPQGARYQVGLNADGLRSVLEEAAPKFSRTPSDARFVFNDDTRQLELIQHAVIGRSLSVDATIQSIKDKVAQGEHQVALVMDTTKPAVTDDVTAEALGIREVVSEQTTYFYGSDNSRIQNIKTAASRFHGVLIPPGGTFSMASIMGDVSLDTGYAEAWIIYGNRTIKGVGGGVCQVSTTLFRTVFFGGFPVVERHPHAYRVSYYEQNAAGQVNSKMAGLDATVYVPVVDFKFKNDTPNWLLMETYTNVKGRSLTWKFYSTSDGRTVDWQTSGLTNIEEPPEPQYVENPDLAKGQIKQVDWEVRGADVSVQRTVTRDGQVYFTDTYNTHYMPWRAVFEYGPGTKIPESSGD